jgi:hypothetical protein
MESTACIAISMAMATVLRAALSKADQPTRIETVGSNSAMPSIALDYLRCALTGF